MQSTIMNFNRLLLNYDKVFKTFINYQAIRWRRPRKPFWLGIAKSKMFIVRQPKLIRTEEESNESLRLNDEYNTQLQSLLNFINKENPLIKQKNESFDENFLKKIEDSYKANENWNAVSAKLRQERSEKSLEECLARAESELLKTKEKEKEEFEKIERRVKEEKIKSESFITYEKLDDAIEVCLNSLVDYNYAIDMEGNKYPGSNPMACTTNVNVEISSSTAD